MESLEQVEALEQVRGYVLGQLNDVEERGFAGRLLSDPKFFHAAEEAREAVLDELVDDYVSGNLPGGDRRAFEERLLDSPEVRDRLPVSYAFFAVRRRPVQRLSWQQRFRLWMQPLLQPKPALAPALAASLVLALAGGIWSLLYIAQLESQLREATSHAVRVDEQRPLSSGIRQTPDVARTPFLDSQTSPDGVPSQGLLAFASYILKPGLQRGSGETTRVPISSSPMIVELKLDVGLDEYSNYRAVLYDSGGDELLSQTSLQAARSEDVVYVILQLPSQILRVDDYQVVLSGISVDERPQTIDRYYFRVSPL